MSCKLFYCKCYFMVKPAPPFRFVYQTLGLDIPGAWPPDLLISRRNFTEVGLFGGRLFETRTLYINMYAVMYVRSTGFLFGPRVFEGGNPKCFDKKKTIEGLCATMCQVDFTCFVKLHCKVSHDYRAMLYT